MITRKASSDWSALLESLADARRRRLLRALRETERIDHVCDRASEWAGPDADDADVRLSMYHSHLPKLADDGLVVWDRERDAVARGPAFAEIVPVLDIVAGAENADRNAAGYC